MNKFLAIACFFLSFIAINSCKTKSEIKKEIKETIKSTYGIDTIFAKMNDAQLNFRTLNIKFKTKITTEKENNSINGNLRMIKDRNIWLSFSIMAGIEAFRVSISPDTIKMINRLNKTFFIGDYQLINDMLKTPFDFDMLQAIIIGNDFSYYENNIFKVIEDLHAYRISTPGRKKLKNYITNSGDLSRILIQDIWIDPYNFKIVKQQIKEVSKKNNKLTVEYPSFMVIENHLFPSKIAANVEAEQILKIIIEYDKVAIDEDVNVSFNIPDSYIPMEEKRKR